MLFFNPILHDRHSWSSCVSSPHPFLSGGNHGFDFKVVISILECVLYRAHMCHPSVIHRILCDICHGLQLRIHGSPSFHCLTFKIWHFIILKFISYEAISSNSFISMLIKIPFCDYVEFMQSFIYGYFNILYMSSTFAIFSHIL